MFTILKTRPCAANDPTIRHLELKLMRFNKGVQRPTATQTDYLTRERIAVQLAEARAYLC